MSALRLVCAGSALAVCLLRDAVVRSKSEAAIEALRSMNADVTMLSNLLRSRRLPLQEALQVLAGEGRLCALWKSAEEGMSDGMSFSDAYIRAQKPKLPKEALNAMSRLASELGRGDIDAELQRLESARSELNTLCEETRRASAEKNRLTHSLSMLMGLAAALLLL